MGVDVVLFVKTDRVLSLEERWSLTWRYCEATGSDDSKYCHGPVFEYREYEGDCGLLHVFCMDRWYGKGYERGNWPSIYGKIQWLLLNFPGCDIFYQPDSSDDERRQPFTEQQAQELWKHWAEFGGEPYRRGFGRDNIDSPKCCGGHIYVNGSGGGERMGYCPCCGSSWETKGGTWGQRKESSNG